MSSDLRLDSRADVVRAFYATFLRSEVAADGQVPGYAAWHGEATDFARCQAERYAAACWAKIDRDRRDPEEGIAAGVRALREHLRWHAGGASDVEVRGDA